MKNTYSVNTSESLLRILNKISNFSTKFIIYQYNGNTYFFTVLKEGITSNLITASLNHKLIEELDTVEIGVFNLNKIITTINISTENIKPVISVTMDDSICTEITVKVGNNKYTTKTSPYLIDGVSMKTFSTAQIVNKYFTEYPVDVIDVQYSIPTDDFSIIKKVLSNTEKLGSILFEIDKTNIVDVSNGETIYKTIPMVISGISDTSDINQDVEDSIDSGSSTCYVPIETIRSNTLSDKIRLKIKSDKFIGMSPDKKGNLIMRMVRKTKDFIGADKLSTPNMIQFIEYDEHSAFNVFISAEK